MVKPMPPVCEQAPYVKRGLPKHVGSLLSSQDIPRGEVAAAVLELLMEQKNMQRDVVSRLKIKRAFLQQIITDYLQLRGLWNARGIMCAACSPELPIVTGIAEHEAEQPPWCGAVLALEEIVLPDESLAQSSCPSTSESGQH